MADHADKFLIDSAIRSIASRTGDDFPWSKWARRWLMGIDRSIAGAKKHACLDDEYGQIAEAAVLWLEAQSLGVNNRERSNKLEESYKLLLLAQGIIP